MKNIFIVFAALFLACSNGQETQSSGIGNSCLPDISNCDVSGNYNLVGSDAAPFFVYSATMPITQDKQPATSVVLAPAFYFYSSTNIYLFRSVGYGTWDGDSLRATVHGKLRLNTNTYPIAGGFSVTFLLDAKQKTFTNASYYGSLMRLPLPALDGTMIVSDSANVIFPTLDTPVKTLFVQY